MTQAVVVVAGSTWPAAATETVAATAEAGASGRRGAFRRHALDQDEAGPSGETVGWH